LAQRMVFEAKINHAFLLERQVPQVAAGDLRGFDSILGNEVERRKTRLNLHAGPVLRSLARKRNDGTNRTCGVGSPEASSHDAIAVVGMKDARVEIDRQTTARAAAEIGYRLRGRNSVRVCDQSVVAVKRYGDGRRAQPGKVGKDRSTCGHALHGQLLQR